MKKNFTDVGHGGNDSGAIGLNKTEEADIVLEVGKMVNDYLKPCNIENRLSRDKDITLSLTARTNASNSWGADTLVSIHCNSYKEKSAHGLEILYMSDNGKELAKCILEELKKEGLYTRLREGNTGLKYQNTHMNRESKATSCLIEMGFITNEDDYKLIMNNKKKFAKCIAKGICKYNKVTFKESNSSSTSSSTSSTFKNGDYTGRTAIVNTDVLNVRYDRGTDHKIIGQLKRGQKVKLNYCLNKWISIEGFKGNKGLGYIHTDYIKLV